MAKTELKRGPKPKVITFNSIDGEFVLSRDNAIAYLEDCINARGDGEEFPKLSDKKYSAERPDVYDAVKVSEEMTIKQLTFLLTAVCLGKERDESED